MKFRCSNPKATGYHNWGGRGIRVCKSWQKFDNFYKDMGDPPSSKHRLDRKNNNGNYTKANCEWRTQRQQMRNMRDNHLVIVGGKKMTLVEAVEGCALTYNTVLYRLKRGWTIEQAITLPPQRGVRPNA